MLCCYRPTITKTTQLFCRVPGSSFVNLVTIVFVIMAARAPAPAKEPPIFQGRPQDDVVEWLQDYEDISENNHWAQRRN